MKGFLFRAWCFVITLSFSFVASADDLEYELPISAVKIHPYSAVITRSKEIQIPAGEHRLIIGNIPASIDPSRLILSIPDAAVRMGSFDIDESDTGSRTSIAEQLLLDELQTLADAREVISDDIKTANTELQLLSSLSNGGSEAGLRPTVNGAELANLIGVISTNSSQARARIRESNIAMRELDQQIRVKQFELNQIATRRVRSSKVTAQLEVATAVSVTVSLSYPVNSARWNWLYEARLDTENSYLAFFRQAVINQNTGEDWTDVDLTLTTANQRVNNATPVLESTFVDIFDVTKML